MAPHPATAAFLAVLFVALPWLAARSHRHGAALALPRAALYLQASISQWVLVLLLGGVLWLEGRGPRSLGLLTILPPRVLLLWTATVVGLGLAAGLAFWAARKRLGGGESALVRHLIPRTTEERLLFALVVAPTAGIVEEMLFRGYAVSRLGELVPGGAWTAAILSLVGFALGHVYQGPLGVCRAALLGAFLSLPFLATGSLLPSILAHTVLDILGGVFLGRYLLEGGEPATPGRLEG